MTITTRTAKGSALTTAELDGNFNDLDTRATANAAAIVARYPATGFTYNGSGQVTGYAQNGVTYVLTYASGLLQTKVGGGRTITYSYNGSNQLTGEAFS